MALVTDYLVTDSGGDAFIVQLNEIFAAIVTGNSSAVAPATTYPFMIWVDTSGATPVIRQRNAANSAWVTLHSALLANELVRLGALSLGAPVTRTADFAVGALENTLINNKAGSSCVVTLPAAAANGGRVLTIVNRQAQTVVSASANVVPQAGGAAGTAILPAVIGAQAVLQSDGVNWLIVESGAVSSAFGSTLMAAADAAAARALIGMSGAPDAVLEDQRASGTSGTGSTAGVWVTRALNTETRDPNNIVTLAANQFTVTVDCWCEFSMPGVGMNNHQARIFNVTDSVVVALGTVEWSPNSGANQTRTFGGGALVAGKTYRIEHRGAVTNANAFGVAASFGNAEVYGRVQLWRL